MKLWKSKKSSSGGGTSCVPSGSGSGGGKGVGSALSKSCNFNGHNSGSSNNSFEDNSVETSFINPTAAAAAVAVGNGTSVSVTTTAGTPSAAGLMQSGGNTTGSMISGKFSWHYFAGFLFLLWARLSSWGGFLARFTTEHVLAVVGSRRAEYVSSTQRLTATWHGNKIMHLNRVKHFCLIAAFLFCEK